MACHQASYRLPTDITSLRGRPAAFALRKMACAKSSEGTQRSSSNRTCHGSRGNLNIADLLFLINMCIGSSMCAINLFSGLVIRPHFCCVHISRCLMMPVPRVCGNKNGRPVLLGEIAPNMTKPFILLCLFSRIILSRSFDRVPPKWMASLLAKLRPLRPPLLPHPHPQRKSR